MESIYAILEKGYCGICGSIPVSTASEPGVIVLGASVVVNIKS